MTDNRICDAKRSEKGKNCSDSGEARGISEKSEFDEPSLDGLPPPMEWSGLQTARGSFERCSLMTAALTHVGLYILMFLGFLNQLCFRSKVATEKKREGYAPLYRPFEQLFSWYVYRRARHCFSRPICSAPGPTISLLRRYSDDYNWTFRLTREKVDCINMASYNYLGYADGGKPVEEARVAEAAVRRCGLTVCSSRAELGTTQLHLDLERTTAEFLGVESAIVFGMGFATNTLTLPGLLTPGTLVFSDENNHTSIIMGLRLAPVEVRLFQHNDVIQLEQLIRKAILEEKWKKIVILVEGVYSVEGSILPLTALLALKKRYGLLLYVDEAHSIGNMGPRGRGITDYWGVDPREVDVLMGTFTKSFASAGGYIAGTRALVSCVRGSGHGHTYAHSMAPPVAQQILSAMRAIDSPAGLRRVRSLRDNTHYFRTKLRDIGVVTSGSDDSPVVPMLVYSFGKMQATVERLMELGVAAVGVAYPAAPILTARIRFSISAAHSRAQLDAVLDAVAAVADELGLRCGRGSTRTSGSNTY